MFHVSVAAPFLVSLPNARLKVSGFQVSMVGVISIVETLRATSRNISDVVGAYNVLWISAICKLFILNNAN